jgi:uncharacterized protein involved in type VI secretion and phage assembly
MSLAELFTPLRGDDTAGKIAGVVVGIVTDNKDPEKMGRVQVNFPWRGDDGQSHWARVASLMAGKEMGTFFLPDVHDEVLVAFDRGDIEHPFIIGALWNGKDKPPETNEDGKNNIRKIKSRSGHELIFCDDGEGKAEKIEIRTQAGHIVRLDDTRGSEKIEILDNTGSNKIVMDSSQNAVSLESAQQLNIKSQKIVIEGAVSLTLKSNADLTIQGLPVKIN